MAAMPDCDSPQMEVKDPPAYTVEPLTDCVRELPFVVAHTGVRRVSGSVLRPIRERWEDGRLVDDPAAVTATARAAGLVPVERCVALLGRLRDGELTPPAASFGHRTCRADGLLLHAPTHDDVLVFTPNPAAAASPAMAVCPPLAAA